MNYATFDIESVNWIDLIYIGFYDGNDFYLFETVSDFLRFVSKPKYKGYKIYAHNGGRFDFLFLLSDEKYFHNFSFGALQNGRPIQLFFNGVEFRDSFSLLPQSLDSLSKSFDVKHKKQKIDYSKIRKNKKTVEYLKYDCIALYEILQKFFQSDYVKNYNLKLTIASQSLEVFSKGFSLFKELSLPTSINSYLRKFYHGGRVEVYKMFGKNLNYYDINSLYPYVMLNEFPSGDFEFTKKYKNGYIGFYEVKCTLPNNYIGLGLVSKEKNYFVNGKGTYYFSSATIDFLVYTFGIKFKIINGIYFKEKYTLFNNFVNFFYNIKQNSDGANKAIAKLFLNSLYGKFGQREIYESIVEYNGQIKFKPLESDFFSGFVIVERNGKHLFSNVAIASYITELARLEHLKYLLECNSNIYYCDTDSFLTTKKFDTSNEIGKLKLVGKYDEGIFLNSKCYALKNKNESKILMKGFSSELFNYNDFENALYYNKEMSQEKNRMLGFKESMKRKNKVLHSNGAFLKLVSEKRTILEKYDKRKLIKNEKYVWNTEPFDFNEIL